MSGARNYNRNVRREMTKRKVQRANELRWSEGKHIDISIETGQHVQMHANLSHSSRNHEK